MNYLCNANSEDNISTIGNRTIKRQSLIMHITLTKHFATGKIMQELE